jgi:hypothetical protein
LSAPPSTPLDRFSCAFQSKAAFMAFSTAGAPPATKKRCRNSSGTASSRNVRTKPAYSRQYTSLFAGLARAAVMSDARNPSSSIPGWLWPIGNVAK